MGEENVFPVLKMPSVKKKRVKIGGMTAFTHYYLTYIYIYIDRYTYTHIYSDCSSSYQIWFKMLEWKLF